MDTVALTSEGPFFVPAILRGGPWLGAKPLATKAKSRLVDVSSRWGSPRKFLMP